MQFKNFFQFMSVATLACTVCLTTQTQGAEAKTNKKHLIAHRSNQYFVPPPPAYQPSVGMTPNYGNMEADASEPAAPANPYSKYIYVRPGSGCQAPTPVQTNRGVTYYSRG